MKLLRRREETSGEDRRALPRLPEPLAAAAVGLLCAVLAMLLVWLGELGCDAVRGAPSCGRAGGVLLALTAAVVLLVGLALLRTLSVADAGLANVLGFALFAIVLMSALLDYVFSAYMWVVLPAVGALTYAAGAWISGLLARVGSS